MQQQQRPRLQQPVQQLQQRPVRLVQVLAGPELRVQPVPVPVVLAVVVLQVLSTPALPVEVAQPGRDRAQPGQDRARRAWVPALAVVRPLSRPVPK